MEGIAYIIWGKDLGSPFNQYCLKFYGPGFSWSGAKDCEGADLPFFLLYVVMGPHSCSFSWALYPTPKGTPFLKMLTVAVEGLAQLSPT